MENSDTETHTSADRLTVDSALGRKLNVDSEEDQKRNKQYFERSCVELSSEEELQVIPKVTADIDPGSALLQSTSTGFGDHDEQVFPSILEGGCPVNAMDSDGCTDLHRAASQGHGEVITELIGKETSSVADHPLVANEGREELLQSGGEGLIVVTTVHMEGGSPPHQTVEGGSPLHQTVEGGSPLHQTVEGESPLHQTVEGESPLHQTVEGGSPLHQTVEGGSPLHQTVEGGSPLHQTVEGGSPLHQTVEGGSPLHQTVEGGSPPHQTVECGSPLHQTVDGGSTLHQTVEGGSPLHQTVEGGSPLHQAVEGGSPLHQAVWAGQEDVVSGLLKAGCLVNVVDSNGQSVLHAAAIVGHTELVRLLVEHGLKVNVQDSSGLTPLHWAAVNNEVEVVCELLRLGALMTIPAEICGSPQHQAVVAGHREVVSVLLDAGCPVDIVDSSGENVLHFAAVAGCVDMMDVLVQCGVDPNAADSIGLTPLHLAVASGKLEAVRELLRLGAQASMTVVAGISGTPLHQAAFGGQKEMVLALLDAGCPVGVAENTGKTALHFACAGGRVELLSLLLEHGLDVNSADSEGCTPLHLASHYGQLQAVHTLLRLGGMASIANVAGTRGTPLHQAALGGHKDIVSVLLDAGCPIDVEDSREASLMHFAAEGGHVGMIAFLHEQGLHVHQTARDGRTPLHHAAFSGQLDAVSELLRLGATASMRTLAVNGGTPLHQAALGGHKEVMSALIDAGCSPHTPDNSGKSILHFAAQRGHSELLRWSVEQGLDVNKGDNDGCTPLHLAAYHKQLEAVRELLELGGRGSLVKDAGDFGTPLHQAALGGHKDMASILLNAGCPINVMKGCDRSVLHFAAQGGHVCLIELFVEHGLDINLEDNEGSTPLHFAAYCNHIEAVRAVVRLGGKSSLTKVAGTSGTPLHQAAVAGHKEMVLELLDTGCPIDLVDSEGKNILHVSAACGHVDLTDFLVQCGLDINSRDGNGLTPLHWAAGNSRVLVVYALLRMGARLDIGAGQFGLNPLAQTICSFGSVDIISALIEVMEQHDELAASSEHGHLDRQDHISDTHAESPLDVRDGLGYTPLIWAAATGQVSVLQELVAHHCDISVHSNFDLSLFEHAVMGGEMNHLMEISKVCGFRAQSLTHLIHILKDNKLMDPRKLLILGSISGDPLVIDTLSNEESVFTKAAHQTFIVAKNLLQDSLGRLISCSIYDELGMSDIMTLTPLQISLLFFKWASCNEGIMMRKESKNYRVFIEQLISHPLTQFTVKELFPNGLSPLDVARQFNFHDIACMIERAGGGPGMWADLPKEIKEKGISSLLSLKALLSHDTGGQEAALRIASHLFGEIPLSTSVLKSEQMASNVLQSKPELKLVFKHVLPRLHHLDSWFDVGVVLDMEEDVLLDIESHSKQDRVAYRTMLSTWLKHGRHVTWQNLFDALWDYEPGRIVEEMKKNIIEELTCVSCCFFCFDKIKYFTSFQSIVLFTGQVS